MRFHLLFTEVALNQMEDRCLVHCCSEQGELREGIISGTLLAKFVRNGAIFGAVITESPSGAIFLVHCRSVQGGRLIEIQVWMQKSVWMQCGYEAEYVAYRGPRALRAFFAHRRR